MIFPALLKPRYWLNFIGLKAKKSVMDANEERITTEYLMTLYAPLDAPLRIDDTLVVYNVREGGWVLGPKINGILVPPGADWFRILPNGSSRLDVRLIIETDDKAFIYMSYNGIVSRSTENADPQKVGEVLTSNDRYFIIVPTLQTSAEKYLWLNDVQCLGKMIEVKSSGKNAFVKYDIYVVR